MAKTHETDLAKAISKASNLSYAQVLEIIRSNRGNGKGSKATPQLSEAALEVKAILDKLPKTSEAGHQLRVTDITGMEGLTLHFTVDGVGYSTYLNFMDGEYDTVVVDSTGKEEIYSESNMLSHKDFYPIQDLYNELHYWRGQVGERTLITAWKELQEFKFIPEPEPQLSKVAKELKKILDASQSKVTCIGLGYQDEWGVYFEFDGEDVFLYEEQMGPDYYDVMEREVIDGMLADTFMNPTEAGVDEELWYNMSDVRSSIAALKDDFGTEGVAAAWDELHPTAVPNAYTYESEGSKIYSSTPLSAEQVQKANEEAYASPTSFPEERVTKAPSLEVIVLHITGNKHGDTVSLHRDIASAEKSLKEYIEAYWEDAWGEIPEDVCQAWDVYQTATLYTEDYTMDFQPVL